MSTVWWYAAKHRGKAVEGEESRARCSSAELSPAMCPWCHPGNYAAHAAKHRADAVVSGPLSATRSTDDETEVWMALELPEEDE